MVTRSGTVYHSETGIPISGASVFSIKAATEEIYATAIANASGQFVVEVDTGGDIVYIPQLSGTESYHYYATPSQDALNLLLANASYVQPTISGDIFTFLVDSTLKTSSTVLNCKITPCHSFVVTALGLDVIQLDDKKNVGWISYSGGFSAIALDATRSTNIPVFLGTTNSGIVSFQFTPPPLPLTNNLTNRLAALSENSLLPSQTITALDYAPSGYLGVATSSGASIWEEDIVFTHLLHSAPMCVHVTNSGDLYYGVSESGIYVKYGPISANWSSPDYVLNATSTPSLLSNTINFITSTTVSGQRHLFIATTSGVTVIQENRANLSASLQQNLTTVISGSTKNVRDLAPVATATLSGGLLYLSTDEVTQSVDLATSSGHRYTTASFEFNLKFSGKTISGSKFVERR